jgi:hypothetical protein
VVGSFNRGATEEEIAQNFTNLELPDVYFIQRNEGGSGHGWRLA